jgi:hypothetical protein
MTMGRYVFLLLASPDATWVETLRKRLAAAAWPAEVVVCRQAYEACARLGSGRRHSALLVDARARLDADLADAAETAGTPVIACGPGAGPLELAQLPKTPAHPVRPVPWGDRLPAWVAELLNTATSPASSQGGLIGVCGPGGTGASVVAMALAQGLAPDNDLLLADFARRPHQTLLHCTSPAASRLPDLIARLRGRRLLGAEVRAGTVPVDGQPYWLLPGPFRPEHWVTVHARTFDIALNALRAAFGLVIADITGDFEGEAETGSLEVEERNHPARRVALTADLVVLVGGAGRTTRHATADTHDRLTALGVETPRILLCANRVSTACEGTLTLGEVELSKDGPLPAGLVAPLRQAVVAELGRLSSSRPAPGWPAIPPGSLGLRGEPV